MIITHIDGQKLQTEKFNMTREYTDDELISEFLPDKPNPVSDVKNKPIDENFTECKDYPPDSSDVIPSDALGMIVNGQEELRISEEDATIVAYIRSSQRDKVKIGKYYIVPYPNGEKLFTKVKELQYKQNYPGDDANEIHSERAETMEIDEHEYKYLAYLEPLCILYDNGNSLERKRTNTLPKPNTSMIKAHELESIQKGLNIPEDGIFVGHLSVDGELIRTESNPDTVAYYLRNKDDSREPLIFRHVIICGSTGTGKTFVGKNIIRQYISDDVRYKIRNPNVSQEIKPCIIILDPQDEYSQISEDNTTIDTDCENNLDMENIKHGGVKNTVTFTAKVGNETYHPTTAAPTKEFTIPFSLVRYNHWLIHGGEMNENQIHALERLLNDYFVSPNANFTYDDFITFIKNLARKEEYTEIHGTIHEATYDSIIRKVENSHFKSVFDQGTSNITDILNQIFVPGQISVFPTEYISSARSRDLIILTIMSMIVDNKLRNTGNKRIKDVPIILALDEAHRYLSSAKSQQARSIVGKFTEAARQGRKESLGLMLITQDPQDIDGDIMKQTNSKVILNLNNESAINSLQIPKKYENKIPFLKRGQMIIHSPDNSDTVELIGLSNCTVKHG